jgi:low temperature requirement protein LtrA
VLSGTLWWLYFDRDDEAAAEAFAATGGNTRSRLGLWIAYVHVVMVAGVILMAAGVRAIVADPGAPARAAAAWNVAAGVGLYVAGESAFRSILHLGPSWRRAVVVGAVVLTVPVGQWVSGVLQLVLVTAAMVVLILTEGARAGQRSGAGDAAIGRGGG